MEPRNQTGQWGAQKLARARSQNPEPWRRGAEAELFLKLYTGGAQGSWTCGDHPAGKWTHLDTASSCSCLSLCPSPVPPCGKPRQKPGAREPGKCSPQGAGVPQGRERLRKASGPAHNPSKELSSEKEKKYTFKYTFKPNISVENMSYCAELLLWTSISFP